MADFDGDGIIDLLSGSNCCAAFRFHWLRGRGDGSFSEMQSIGFLRTEVEPTRFMFLFGREITRPRVFDWNRDGKDDLVMGMREIRVDRNLRSFEVDAWLQTVEKEKQAEAAHDYDAQNHLRTTNVVIPEFNRLRQPDASEERLREPNNVNASLVTVDMDDGLRVDRRTFPAYVEFADWDGDGNVDLLAIIESHFALRAQQPRHTIFWLRNKTSTGEPEFDAAQPLYQVQGNVVLQSFTVIDWDDDGTNELVVSVTERDPKNTMKIFDQRLQLLAMP